MKTSMSLYDILQEYSQAVTPEELRQVRTALVRYLVSGLGGPSPVGARVQSAELEAAMNYLKTVSADRLKDASAIQEKVFASVDVSATSRRNYRHHLKKFCQWAENKGYWSTVDDADCGTETPKNEYVFFKRTDERSLRPRDYRKQMGVTRSLPRQVALSKRGKKLEEEIAAFREWRKTQARDVTIDWSIHTVSMLLGWFAREHGIPEDHISLQDLFPFTRIHYDESEFEHCENPMLESVIVEQKAAKLAKVEADLLIKRIEAYFNAFPDTTYLTKMSYITHYINFASWVYREETQTEDFSDIPMVYRIRELRLRYKKLSKNESPRVPYSLKSVEWPELFRVALVLKKEADTLRNRNHTKRPETSVGTSIQKLIIFSLFLVMPPRRSRVIVELSLGRTLQKGRVKPGIGFVPEAILAKGENPVWCLVLDPKDYKTGDKYGSQAFEINNMPYGDGTFFYDYLNQWINYYRPLFQPNHNYVFLKTKFSVGDPPKRQTIYDIVQHATLRVLGIPVAPKEIRKIFVSYISQRHDLSEADMEAAARAMGHSRRTQMDVYDQV